MKIHCAEPTRKFRHAELGTLDPLLRVALGILAQAAEDAQATDNPGRAREALNWLEVVGVHWIAILEGTK